MRAIAPDTKPELFECCDLWASYGGAQALTGVSLILRQGEIVGLCGPNKAGKSTLALCTAGVKALDRGRIFWQGRNITNWSSSERFLGGISLCPEWRGIYASLTVRENLTLGAGEVSLSELKEGLSVVLKYFPVLGQHGRMEQRAGTLSGGEARMLAVAKKLMRLATVPGGSGRNPYLLILDEASSGLSPAFTSSLFQTVSDIRRDYGVTVLAIEEGLGRLAGLVDRAYLLNHGAVVAKGTIMELEQHESVVSVFGGETVRNHGER